MHTYTQLKAWQKGRLLVKEVFATTPLFPKSELYGLAAQIKRSAVSITSNIAEGFGRFSKKEKIQFYYIAVASINELQNQLLIATESGFLERNKYLEMDGLLVEVRMITSGLIRSTKRGLP